MKDLIERKKDESDRLTLAIANGYVLSMSKEAQAKWRLDHARPTGAGLEAVSRQSQAFARLATLFPGAVKAKAN